MHSDHKHLHVAAATPADWERMREIFRAAGRVAWSSIFDPEGLVVLEPPARWRDLIGRQLPEAEVWIAKHAPNEPAAGFVVIRASRDVDASAQTGEVDSFYTHPDLWGVGAGRLLMTQALHRLSGFGFREATLWTETRNERARAFYERAGFRLDGAERRRTLRGTDLVEDRWRKILTDPDRSEA